MFRTTFYFFILFTCLYLNAQENLIVNGSFEDYSSCPTGNDLGDGQFQRCTGWWYSNPSGIGSPDYFNRCATSIVGIPNNFWGYQEAYDGDGYIGILPLSWMISEGIDFSREMIQTKLRKKLLPCYKYRFELSLNLSNLSNFKLDNLQISISQDSVFHNTLDNISVYKNLKKLPVRTVDTSAWQTLSIEFDAQGGEQFLSLGYLKKDYSFDTIYIQTSSLSNTEAAPYYFIDNIQLIRLPIISNCNLDLPNTFTPNNDGNNDSYDLSKYLDIFEISIVNRWGNLVFELTKEQSNWNGTDRNGKPCSDGVYYYQIKSKEEKENIKSGFIHLFR